MDNVIYGRHYRVREGEKMKKLRPKNLNRKVVLEKEKIRKGYVECR